MSTTAPTTVINTAAQLPKTAVRLFNPKPTLSGRTFSKLSAQETWKVPYPDLYNFLTVVGGGVTGQQGAIVRTLPMQHPEFTPLIAMQVDGHYEGWDTAGTGDFNNVVVGNKGWYSNVFVTVTFETPPWAINGTDAFLTLSAQTSGRNMFVPAAAGTLTDGTHPLHDPGIFVPGFTYSLTVHMLPYLAEGLWLGYEGCVNSTTFRNCGAGQVLYTGASWTRTTTFIGTTTYEVTHNFEVSAIPWNYEFGASGVDQEWKPNGVDRYPAVDLNQIFVL